MHPAQTLTWMDARVCQYHLDNLLPSSSLGFVPTCFFVGTFGFILFCYLLKLSTNQSVSCLHMSELSLGVILATCLLTAHWRLMGRRPSSRQTWPLSWVLLGWDWICFCYLSSELVDHDVVLLLSVSVSVSLDSVRVRVNVRHLRSLNIQMLMPLWLQFCTILQMSSWFLVRMGRCEQ